MFLDIFRDNNAMADSCDGLEWVPDDGDGDSETDKALLSAEEVGITVELLFVFFSVKLAKEKKNSN